MKIPRYKVVVQVVIGEVKGQDTRVTSRCLWDSKTDNYTSVSFKNVCFYIIEILFLIWAILVIF